MINALKRCLAATALALLVAFAPPALACSVPEVRVALFDFPPFYRKDPEGVARGTLVELLNRVMDRAGCVWSTRFYETVPRMLEQLVSGEVDLAMVIRHPMLETRALFGSVPVATLVMNTYHQPDRPAVGDLEGLRGKRLIVIRGYGYAGLIERLLDPRSGIELVVAGEHREAFTWLQAGRGDYLLDYQGPGGETLKQMGLYHLGYSTLQSKDVFFVLSPRLAEPQRLLAELEAALQEEALLPVRAPQ